jgi:type I protein arginine methyltransferase
MNDDFAEGDDNFEDWEDDEDEEIFVKSLFSNSNHNSMEKFMQHDKDNFGFDLLEVVAASKFDDIRLIKLVNMIRRRVKDAGEHAIDPTFISNLKSDILRDDLLDDQDNMLPVLREDPVLFLLRDELVKNGIMADDDDDDDDVQAAEVGNEFVPGISDMKETLSRYQSLITSLTSSPDVADDSYYFDGYSNISIHETMLRDEPRTTSYADALVANCKFMKGKVVLDVGCGTGILCMLAVRAGARKVIGVDSSSIIERAQKVIDRNGMSDKITLVRGRLEEVKLPLEHDEVDVIVSEWMGYGLYFENMLSSVIYARDTYLSNNGILMPSDAKVYIEAMTAAGEVDRVAWWGNVYGFDMTDMADLLCCDAQVQLVENEDIISDRSLAHSLNMNQASDADLDFDAPFEMVIFI